MDPITARHEVAANVRALMGRGIDGKRVTQTQLGAVLKLSQGPVSERLSGKTPFSFDELLAVADHFNVSIASLIIDVDEHRRPVGQGNRLSIWFDGTDQDVDQLVNDLRKPYDVPLDYPELRLARAA